MPRGFCYGDIPLRIAFLFSAWLLSVGALAAPGEVATLDRSTWPEQLNSPTLFDVASRAEILMFATVLLASESLDEPSLAQRLGLRTINLESVNNLRQRLWQRLLSNYNFAQQSCDQDASFCFWSRTWTPCASRQPSFSSVTTATTSSGQNRVACSIPDTWTSNYARPHCLRRPAAKSNVLATMSATATG